MKPNKRKGLRSIPGQVQLPGGVVLKGLRFKIVEYNEDGTPKLFELLSVGADLPIDGGCVLFAQEEWIRSPIGAGTKAKADE